MYSVNSISRQIFIGRKGETGTRSVQFDVSAWMQINDGLTVGIVAIRPGETEAYVPAEVTAANGVLTWVPDAVDTAIPGTGVMLIRGTDSDGNVIKSAQTTYVVESAFDDDGYTPTPVEESWLTHAEAELAAFIAQGVGPVVTDWLDENITQETGYVLDRSLTVQDAAADAKATGDAVAAKVSKPATSPNGTNGQVLRSLGNGSTEWANVAAPTDAQVGEAVSDWLDDHPEAVTTVDFSIVTKVFPTVADMASDLTLESGDNVATRGYYASGDNGGSSYVVSSSHTGVFYITLSNGLYANRMDETGWVNANAIGIKSHTATVEEPDENEMDENVIQFQKAIDGGINLQFQIGHYYFSDEIELRRKNTLRISGIDRLKSVLHFPSSKGFNFSDTIYYNYWVIEHIGIDSYNDCIYISDNACSLMDCHFYDLDLVSNQNDCVHGTSYNVAHYTTAGGTEMYDTCAQNCVFDVVDARADNGASFANFMGLGNQWYHINIRGGTLYGFQNCDGRIEHLNTLGTGQDYMFYYDHAYSHSLYLHLVNVNAEGLLKAFIFTEPEVQLEPGEDSRKPTNANIMTLKSLVAVDSGWSLNSSAGNSHNVYPITVHKILRVDVKGWETIITPNAYPSRYNTTSVKGQIRELVTFGLRRIYGIETIKDAAGSSGNLVYTLYGDKQDKVIQNLGHGGEYGTERVRNFDMLNIDRLYGGKATQIYNMKASTHSVSAINPTDEYKYCDVINYTVDQTSDKYITTICINSIGTIPGRILTIVNNSTSQANLVILNYADTGYSHGIIDDENGSITITPNTSATFITRLWLAPNGNTYNAWHKLL